MRANVQNDKNLVNGCYLLAFLIRFGGNLPHANWEAYLATAPWITVATLFFLQLRPLHSRQVPLGGNIHFAALCSSHPLFSFNWLLHQFAFPRSIFLIAAPLQLLLLGLWRRFTWAWSMTRMGPLQLEVVGSLSRAQERARQLLQTSGGMYEVAATPKPHEAPSTLAVLGRSIIEPEVFVLLQKQQPGAGGEIQLTDALRSLIMERPMYCIRGPALRRSSP